MTSVNMSSQEANTSMRPHYIPNYSYNQVSLKCFIRDLVLEAIGVGWE